MKYDDGDDARKKTTTTKMERKTNRNWKRIWQSSHVRYKSRQ